MHVRDVYKNPSCCHKHLHPLPDMHNTNTYRSEECFLFLWQKVRRMLLVFILRRWLTHGSTNQLTNDSFLLDPHAICTMDSSFFGSFFYYFWPFPHFLFSSVGKPPQQKNKARNRAFLKGIYISLSLSYRVTEQYKHVHESARNRTYLEGGIYISKEYT